MPSGHLVKVGNYCRMFLDKEYEQGGNRKVQITMLTCEDDNPPAYQTNSGILS